MQVCSGTSLHLGGSGVPRWLCEVELCGRPRLLALSAHRHSKAPLHNSFQKEDHCYLQAKNVLHKTVVKKEQTGRSTGRLCLFLKELGGRLKGLMY